ncbi:MAG: sensor domain-containing diguanylate cyclase, partial [Gammaproteobacteria bacterium]|nr:sensor domain-containing diguanylate cyclase [Gammaproteobacteria bacterium]
RTALTERRKNEAAMQLASTVLDASPGGILVTDADKRIIAVNPAFTRLTGYSLEDILYQNPHILSSGQQDETFYQSMWASIQQHGRWEGELVNRRKDGQLLPELLSISQVSDKKGNVVNYVGMFLDITERWQAASRIQYLAHHDYLTGLPNRLALVEHATHALTLARRYKRRLAIFYIDLDRFKPINDLYGHNVGDIILKIVAQRLLSMVRESDTVCRQGGDEFVILLPEFTDVAHLERLAIKIREEIQAPCQISDIETPLIISASIGIATYPDNGDTVDAIIQSADSAMYSAKADKEKHICFAPSLSTARED